MEYPITRKHALETLRSVLEPVGFIKAMWEGGAAAFNRADEWSDIDLAIVADDDKIAEAWEWTEKAVAAVAPVDLRYVLPNPTWHGHEQAFYRWHGASPYLLLDVSLIRLSAENKFLEPEMHGNVIVHFDKADIVANAPHLDSGAQRDRIRNRLQNLRITYPMFSILVTKEIHRSNHIEAISFYHNFTLRPLVELMRMKYAPDRFTFHTRYVHYDLPPDAVRTLQELYYIGNPSQLGEAHARAERILEELWNGLAVIYGLQETENA